MKELRYAIAVSIMQTVELPEDCTDPIEAVLADAGHKAIIDGIRGRVEALRMDDPKRGIVLSVRDLVIASDEWQG